MSSRSKMPHNNRVSSSTALKTNDMWSKTIGYDPYANQDEDKDTEKNAIHAESLMLLARISNLSGVESRGGCQKCGMLGHLTYQCRNLVPKDESKDESSESDSDDSEIAPLNSSGGNEQKRSENKDKPKKKKEKKRKRESDSEDEEGSVLSSSSSDSEESRKKSKKEKKHKKKKSKKSKKHKKQKH